MGRNFTEPKPIRIVNPPSDYMIETWGILFEMKPVISRTVFERLNKKMGNPPSRASVINYLNTLVGANLLTFDEQLGKGGVHREYTLNGSPSTFMKRITELNNEQFTEAYIDPIAGQF